MDATGPRESGEPRRGAASDASRHRYLDAGLVVLAEQGYPALKLAAICRQIGTTTGSFYHVFHSWSAYLAALSEHWRSQAAHELILATARAGEPDVGLASTSDFDLSLTRSIRVWAAIDPDVARVVSEVDVERRSALQTTLARWVTDPGERRHLASATVHLMTAFELGAGTVEDIEWAVARLRGPARGQGIIS